jgi:hypothetical protein
MSDELKKTGEILDVLAANPPEPMMPETSGAAGLVDSNGVTFDPAIHRVDETGAPVIGSRKQFLMKKEAKKSAAKWVKDKFSELWNGENPENSELPENQELPLSDHEIDKIQAEIQEKQKAEASELVEKNAALTVSAENSADIFFIGGSMALGIEFLNQRDRFHPEVSKIIYEYERRTGKSIDLPPGVALALGLGRIGWEIVQREPACKARFDAGAKVVRDNALKFIGRRLPKFGKPEEVGGEHGAA